MKDKILKGLAVGLVWVSSPKNVIKLVMKLIATGFVIFAIFSGNFLLSLLGAAIVCYGVLYYLGRAYLFDSWNPNHWW